ncbi:hypothetical protein BU17DRAFT_82611 [Hysterangium stoloniferum]|nr:hypothetical protein BU17DRAFT_82611 [Hysterangium stoloniferum]
MPITNSDNLQAIKLSRQAVAAEFAGQYREAGELYGAAAVSVQKAISVLKKKSEERRRAKLQLRAANERRLALQPCIAGTGPPPEILPSSDTFLREVTHPTPGTLLITMVQLGRRAVMAEAPQLLQQEPQHDPTQPPLLSNLLSPTLPNLTYHVYAERITRTNGTWIYLHVKNEAKAQILYTLEACKKARYQISHSTLSRAAEYHGACAMAIITPVRPRKYEYEHRVVGRPFKIHMLETNVEISESPDRFEKDWNPRRFTYAGRRFVWKYKGSTNRVSSLHEVAREWPDPHSKTGKILDEIHPRALVWGEDKFAVEKVCTIHMVGGLDQTFREFLLVSELTKQLIQVGG